MHTLIESLSNSSPDLGVNDIFHVPPKGQLIMYPEALGMPLSLKFIQNGSLIEMDQKADGAFFADDNLRVFAVPDVLIQDWSQQTISVEDAYKKAKEADRLWKRVTVAGQPIGNKADEKYWLIFSWVPHPETDDRSDVKTMLALKIDPHAGTVERIVLDPYAPIQGRKGVTTGLSWINRVFNRGRTTVEKPSVKLADFNRQTALLQLTDGPLTVGPESLGIPVLLTFNGHGEEFSISGAPGAEILESRTFRVFALPQSQLIEVEKAKTIHERYLKLKRANRLPKYIMHRRPVRIGKELNIGEEPYVILFMHQPEDSSGDRSKVREFVRVYVDPRKRLAERVLTGQVVSINVGDTVDLDLLSRNSAVRITNTTDPIADRNVLCLNGFPNPKGAEFSFHILRSDDTREIVLSRPAGVFEGKDENEQEVTDGSNRVTRLFGADGVVLNGIAYPMESRKHDQIRIPLVPGRLEITNRTGSRLRRVLAAFEIGADGTLTWLSGTEEGTWVPSGAGGRRIIYSYEQQVLADERQNMDGIRFSYGSRMQVSDTMVLEEQPDNLTLDEQLERNRKMKLRILERFGITESLPGTTNIQPKAQRPGENTLFNRSGKR